MKFLSTFLLIAFVTNGFEEGLDFVEMTLNYVKLKPIMY